VYRGIKTKYWNLDDYEENGIHYWPLFTSTSKKLSVAKDFGTKLFEIYLTKENQPPT